MNRCTFGILLLAALVTGLAWMAAPVLPAHAQPPIQPPRPGLGAILQTCPAGAVVFVDGDATGNNDGTSWSDAFTALQDGLFVARVCSGVEEVWVAEGAYTPDEGSGQVDNDRHATFQLLNGVALYGGFDGTEAALGDRDWSTHVTILSGDLDGSDTNDDGNTIAETWTDIQGSNSYHVVTGSGTDSTALLDGFTVTAGQAAFGWAVFTGKATYQEPGWPEPIGNHSFTVYVEDWGNPGSGDCFWIEVVDSGGAPVTLALPWDPAYEAVALAAGNILVPSSGR